MSTNHLFAPFSLGNFQTKNRIALAPMTRGRAGADRIPNELMAEYYYQRASAGLQITEATVISAQGIGWIDSPGIYTEAMIDGWRKVTNKLKPTGTPIFLQLLNISKSRKQSKTTSFIYNVYNIFALTFFRFVSIHYIPRSQTKIQ